MQVETVPCPDGPLHASITLFLAPMASKPPIVPRTRPATPTPPMTSPSVRHGEAGDPVASMTGGGITGDIAYDVIMLPELKFSTGGFETLLRPAPVSLQTDVGSGHHGNLGLDLMNQARSVTIDFRSMRLTLSN